MRRIFRAGRGVQFHYHRIVAGLQPAILFRQPTQGDALGYLISALQAEKRVLSTHPEQCPGYLISALQAKIRVLATHPERCPGYLISALQAKIRVLAKTGQRFKK